MFIPGACKILLPSSVICLTTVASIPSIISASPLFRATTRAELSLMNLKMTFLARALVPQYSSLRTKTMFSSFDHFTNLYAPVPTGTWFTLFLLSVKALGLIIGALMTMARLLRNGVLGAVKFTLTVFASTTSTSFTEPYTKEAYAMSSVTLGANWRSMLNFTAAALSLIHISEPTRL